MSNFSISVFDELCLCRPCATSDRIPIMCSVKYHKCFVRNRKTFGWRCVSHVKLNSQERVKCSISWIILCFYCTSVRRGHTRPSNVFNLHLWNVSRFEFQIFTFCLWPFIRRFFINCKNNRKYYIICIIPNWEYFHKFNEFTSDSKNNIGQIQGIYLGLFSRFAGVDLNWVGYTVGRKTTSLKLTSQHFRK